MGIAGTQASIDGSTPSNLAGLIGGCDWLKNTTVFGQGDLGSGFRLYTYDAALNTPPVQVAAVGANTTWAGGDVWQAWLAGTGLYTSDPPGLGTATGGTPSKTIALAGPAAVDALTGSQVVIIDRSTGFGLQVYDDTGAAGVSVSTVLALADPIRLRSNVLSYIDAGGWHLVDISTGTPVSYLAAVTTVDWLVPCVTGSSVYVLERNTNDELTFRLSTQSQGFVVTSGSPTLFNPDARFLSATTVRIAYSLTSGEAASDLIVHDVNIQTGAHSKATVVAGSLVFVAQPNLPVLQIPGTGGSAALRAQVHGIYQQPLINRNAGDRMTVPWYQLMQAIVQNITTPIALNSGQVTGVLQQGNGGTGTTTGLTVISPPTVSFTQASVLLGRGAGAGGGQGQEITLGSNLSMSGTTLNASGGSGITQLTGDVIAGPGSGSQAATIPNGTVTYAKMQDVSAASRLLGRGSSAGAGDVQELTLGTNLSLSGTTLNASSGGPDDGYWSVLTDGDPTAPELIFAGGDVVSVWVPL